MITLDDIKLAITEDREKRIQDSIGDILSKLRDGDYKLNGASELIVFINVDEDIQASVIEKLEQVENFGTRATLSSKGKLIVNTVHLKNGFVIEKKNQLKDQAKEIVEALEKKFRNKEIEVDRGSVKVFNRFEKEIEQPDYTKRLIKKMYPDANVDVDDNYVYIIFYA